MEHTFREHFTDNLTGIQPANLAGLQEISN